MALNKPVFKQTIKSLLINLSERVDDPGQAREDFAEQLSTAIEVFVKSATVTVTVTTTGSATNHTGTGTGTLS